jgi:hypothetical protein
MRQLPRLPDNASTDEKIRIIYDWLYELQMEMNGGNTDADNSAGTEQFTEV